MATVSEITTIAHKKALRLLSKGILHSGSSEFQKFVDLFVEAEREAADNALKFATPRAPSFPNGGRDV